MNYNLPAPATALGRRLRAERIVAGLTLNGLAAKAGYSRSHLSQLELGRAYNCSHETLEALAECLSIPLADLELLAGAYPSALNRNDLAVAAELSPGSGTFGTYLGKLRTLELIEGSAEISLSPELSDGGAA